MLFIIDTEEYSGNFEREMCAFCTGQVGECGVGQKEADVFKEECPEWIEIFDDIVGSEPDDHGCYRPVSIYTTPGFFNDGMGGHYRDPEKGSKKVKDNYEKYHEEKSSGPGDYPAYQSVAIFLNEIPNKPTIDFLMERAKLFTTRSPKKIPIIGFRLIKERHECQLGHADIDN